MYSDNIEDDRMVESSNPIPLTVFLARSTIYAPTTTDGSCCATQDGEERFVVNVPLCPGLMVPLDALVRELAKCSRRNFYHNQILYKLPGDRMYVLAGIFPFEQPVPCLPLQTVTDPIFIKSRVAVENRPNLPSEAHEEEKKNKVRRGNERKIGEVIDALMKWKRLFTYGTADNEGRTVRCTRQEAARVVSIPKKTLDDYSFQIRLGKRNGFDFDMHCREKIGVLRDFNRKAGGRGIDSEHI